MWSQYISIDTLSGGGGGGTGDFISTLPTPLRIEDDGWECALTAIQVPMGWSNVNGGSLRLVFKNSKLSDGNNTVSTYIKIPNNLYLGPEDVAYALKRAAEHKTIMLPSDNQGTVTPVKVSDILDIHEVAGAIVMKLKWNSPYKLTISPSAKLKHLFNMEAFESWTLEGCNPARVTGILKGDRCLTNVSVLCNMVEAYESNGEYVPEIHSLKLAALAKSVGNQSSLIVHEEVTHPRYLKLRPGTYNTLEFKFIDQNKEKVDFGESLGAGRTVRASLRYRPFIKIDLHLRRSGHGGPAGIFRHFHQWS